jgi:hypothetical protein
MPVVPRESEGVARSSAATSLGSHRDACKHIRVGLMDIFYNIFVRQSSLGFVFRRLKLNSLYPRKITKWWLGKLNLTEG